MGVTNLSALKVDSLSIANGAVATGDQAVTGNLSVTGTSTLTGNVAVTGTSTLTGALDAKAAATLEGPLILKAAAVAVLALDVTLGPCYTKTIAADSTFTASAAGTAGQVIILVITASAAQRIATFGSNLNASGTLTIPSGKVGTIMFVSDATSFREVGRSINA